MTNPDDPAYPVKAWDGSLQEAVTPRGLSKREYFAAMAMNLLERFSVHAIVDFEEEAKHCVMMADALIAELNKEKP